MIRESQRQPRACLVCARRRVKCNKELPCSNCIRRGEVADCRRELVKVKGKFHNTHDSGRRKDRVQSNYALASKQDLIQRIHDLEDAMERNESHHETQFTIKKDIDFYCSVTLYFTRELDRRPYPMKFFNHESLKILHITITQAISDRLINFYLDRLEFVHCIIHPSSFREEYVDFWNQKLPRHISLEFDRSIESYLWTSLWYSIICFSLSCSSDKLMEEIQLDASEQTELAQSALYASLECLHRAQYLRCPSIVSLQVFCILSSCFYVLGGVHLQNNLLASMVNVAQALNLHNPPEEHMTSLNIEFSRRTWWFLTLVDWLENTNRTCLISPGSFTTHVPRNIIDEELCPCLSKKPEESCYFEAISYNKVIIEISMIRKKLYSEGEYDVTYSNLQDLLDADKEIDLVEEKWLQVISCTPRGPNLNFQTFLLIIDFNHQRLLINRSILSHLSRRTLILKHRKKCIDAAISTLQRALSDVPSFYLKYWLVAEQSLHACVFLLFDILVSRPYNYDATILLLIDAVLSKMVPLRATHVNVNRGLQLMDTLKHHIHQEKPFKPENINLEKLSNFLKGAPEFYKCHQCNSDNVAPETKNLENEWQELVNFIVDPEF